jgi:hypothetical protein
MFRNINKNTPGATMFLFTASIACKKRGLKKFSINIYADEVEKLLLCCVFILLLSTTDATEE